MKLFNSLPETIRQNGKTYKIDVSLISTFATARDINEIKLRLRKEQRAFLTVHVLAKNLRGKTDLHGQLYKPSTWLFTEQKQTNS